MFKVNIFLRKRKALLVFVTLIFISISMTFQASASPSQDKPKVIFQKDEITDLNKLFDLAKRGISDIEHSKFKPKATIKDDKGNIAEIDTYSTTQHLKTLKHSDGTQNDYFVTTTFAVIPAATGSKPFEKWDSSYGIRAYSTIYWSTVNDPNGLLYYRFDKTTGGWERSDSTLLLSNREVMLGQYGWNLGGGWSNPTKTYYPTSNTYTYSPGWQPVFGGGDFDFGMNCTVTIKHGSSGSPWELHMVNTYKEAY